MTSIFRIGGANAVDLLDKTVFAGFNVQDDAINRQVVYDPTGCFGSAGRSAVLRKAKTLGWTRRYTMFATGSTMDNAIANLLTIENEIKAAEMWNLGIRDERDSITPYPAWVVRTVKDQVIPSVWTILFGSVSESQSVVMSLDQLFCCGAVELFLMKGAPNLDGSGFPIAV